MLVCVLSDIKFEVYVFFGPATDISTTVTLISFAFDHDMWW